MVISTSFFHGGQPIPQAGVYRVIHDPLLPKLTKSPASRQELSTLQACADARFELVRAVSWVEEIGTPAFGTALRSAGWVLIREDRACSRRGFGLTKEPATFRLWGNGGIKEMRRHGDL